MARGIDGRDIFSDDADRIYFLGLLASVVSKTGYRCYGWVLMKNHYHLIVRTSEQPLNGLMRVLNSLYAKYYIQSMHGGDTCFSTGLNQSSVRTSTILKN
jgi:REP element-mobilizing transposase RayT